MGSELVSDSLPLNEGVEKSTLSSYTDLFYTHLPYYLAVGMSSHEFWEEDVSLCKAYREADEIKKQRDNQRLWLQGAYVYEAIMDVAPILIPFSKAKKPEPYLDEPIALNEKELKAKQKREEEVRRKKFKEDMMLWMERTNQQFLEKQGKEVKDNG